METGYVESEQGIKLFYRWVGEGEQVLVIPDIGLMEFDLDPLSKRRRLLIYHLRGRGASSAVTDETKLSMEKDLADLLAVVDHFGLARFCLMGWSYLGVIGAVYAMRYGQTLERFITGGSLPPRAEGPAKEVVAARQSAAEERAEEFQLRVAELRAKGVDESDPVTFRKAEAKASLSKRMGDPSALENMKSDPSQYENEWAENSERTLGIVMRTFGGQIAADFRSLRLDVPTLVVYGGEEIAPPPEGATKWVGEHSDTRLSILPGAGHFPWLDARPEFLSAVEEFLDGGWPHSARPITSQLPLIATQPGPETEQSKRS